MSQIQNIPELRFPEFKGSWDKTTLGDIASFSKGKGISKSDISEDGGIECIRYGELYTEYSEIIEKIVSKTNLSKKELVFSKHNDVIIPSSGETQIDIATASCVLKSDVALGGDLNIIKTPNNGVFLAFYLNNKKKKDIASFAQGNSVVHLYSKQLALLKLKLPSLPEQQKIATFLTSVDKRIQALVHKKELLEQYKKGVMQKIFSREIRFQPDTIFHRLPIAAEPKTIYNGNDAYPNWVEKKLAEVCNVIIGGTPNTSIKEFWGGNIGWMGSGEIKNNRIKEPSKYITRLGLKKSSTVILPINTVVLAMTGATLGKIGILEFECAGNQSVAGFIPSSNFIPLFLFYQMQMQTNQIYAYAGGAAQVGINKKNIESLKIKLPCLEEQQKIAGFLSAIDAKIEAVTSQIDHSKTFKKGLLQKMFV